MDGRASALGVERAVCRCDLGCARIRYVSGRTLVARGHMTDEQRKPFALGYHLIAVSLVAGGVIILAGVGIFVWWSAGFHLSPLEEMIQSVAVLTPFVLLALLMIGYGRRMLRKE